MTNELSTERAIEALYTVRAYYASLTAGYPKGKDCRGIGDVMCSEIANSCLMAIKALEQQPKTETHGSTYGGVSWGGTYKPQQPCEDCISREQAVNELKLAYFNKDLQSAKDDPCIVDAMTDWAIRIIKRLPSVTPKFCWTKCRK